MIHVRRTERHLPQIVCLCGSTRFGEAFRAANLSETVEGRIVLTVGCDLKSDDALGLPPDTKAKLDDLHLHKIDLADRVLILNVGGYIGSSTLRELSYAIYLGKIIDFLDPAAGEMVMQAKSHEMGAMVAGFIDLR